MRLNKRGQFFILSAIILSAILINLYTVRNYVSEGDAPKNFYFYSQMLNDETGAVIDYALYNDPSRTNTSLQADVRRFMSRAIDIIAQKDPDMEVFACYTSENYTRLSCQNNGTSTIRINTTEYGSLIELLGSKSEYVRHWECPRRTRDGKCEVPEPITQNFISIAGENNIFIKTMSDGIVYTIPIKNPEVQKNQFYFILKINTSSGTYVSDSNSAYKQTP